jgi:hypothetical protein
MDIWFEFLNVHMNEKTTTCHYYRGFKWKNINIYSILIFFFMIQRPFRFICLFKVNINFDHKLVKDAKHF